MRRNRANPSARGFGTPPGAPGETFRRAFGTQKPATKPLCGCHEVVPKHSGRLLPPNRKSSECVMQTLESRPRSEGWDPALWSIGTVLGIAILYVACLV